MDSKTLAKELGVSHKQLYAAYGEIDCDMALGRHLIKCNLVLSEPNFLSEMSESLCLAIAVKLNKVGAYSSIFFKDVFRKPDTLPDEGWSIWYSQTQDNLHFADPFDSGRFAKDWRKVCTMNINEAVSLVAKYWDKRKRKNSFFEVYNIFSTNKKKINNE
jgi:hypothetical protein